MEPEVVGSEASGDGPGGEDVASPEPLQPTVFDRVVGILASMELRRPDVQRCTPASTAVWVLASRSRVDPDKVYSWGWQAASISQFWSHSWHCSKWAKICMLLIINNGLPAICLSSISAVLLSVALWVVRSPTISAEERVVAATFQEQYHVIVASEQPAGVASNVLGLLVVALTLVFWRSRKTVFLDRVCVHQSDPELKLAGLCSISGILQNSEELLVCWDTSYARRLWCLFELAAFLRSHGRNAKLLVRPIVLGPVAIGVFIGFSFATLAILLIPRAGSEGGSIVTRIFLLIMMGVLAFWYPLATLRGFYRSIDKMEEQLRRFRLEDATCHCCTVGHQNRGVNTVCDREVIEQCIAQWFGSREAFENCVQTTVSKALSKQLGQFSFPISWMFGCSSPLIWTFAAPAIRQPLVGIFFILAWSFAVPAVFMIGATAAFKLRTKPSNKCLDKAMTLVCVLACMFSYMGMETLAALLSTALTYWQGVAAFAASMVFVTGSIWLCWSRRARSSREVYRHDLSKGLDDSTC